ncbi:flagellar hook-basal body complex protein FliE [Stenotrophomonas aracearum]|jgi:flagellar hook-basal body complex protein FliE|uniref:Flagellar hook-basal body complex protein FliE n=1 Tax=Stenotrophomonas aracearum TaxID=3003272 RepID=A0ABY9YDZ0_9GAMM|nr:flagellar hook-basal body complex protein FliE [Stenotrophomonas sp. A5588]WNH48593.1 flagellar hook-basal body complex protein FliE [Stenotrophomonas sp. A5588]
MAVEAIGAVDALRLLPTGPAEPGRTADFSAAIGQGVQHLEGRLQAADAATKALASGKDVPVHEVMIALEQARMELTFAVEVRNRLLESYQELARMQL